MTSDMQQEFLHRVLHTNALKGSSLLPSNNPHMGFNDFASISQGRSNIYLPLGYPGLSHRQVASGTLGQCIKREIQPPGLPVNLWVRGARGGRSVVSSGPGGGKPRRAGASGGSVPRCSGPAARLGPL